MIFYEINELQSEQSSGVSDPTRNEKEYQIRQAPLAWINHIIPGPD